MPHLNDMEKKYIEKLMEFSNQHPDYGSASDIWKAINQADPDNQRHIHTRWLLERTLSDDKDKRILWEDIAAGSNSKAHDILKRFLTIRPMLPHDKRNLYRYSNLADITEIIRPLEHVKMPGELKAEERERVDNDTVVLYEQDGYKVLVPMSEEASCYWGRGTEWCTAATKSSNAFRHYHEEGPLVIVITPDGKKVQIHQDSPPMDENDEEISEITDLIILSVCLVLGKFDSISDTSKTYDVYLEAVRYNGCLLQDVPKELRDREMCLEALKQKGRSLQYVPNHLRDREMCWEAVKQNGWALQYVPNHLRDREICFEAVKQNGLSSIYVPKKIRDREMCLFAVKQDGRALDFVPKPWRDREMCLQAVRQYGWSLGEVPKKLQDKDIFLEAVKNNGFALKLIPMELRDKDICLEAVKSIGEILSHVPEELRDKAFCIEAIKKSGYALLHVPKELRDREMCLNAVKKRGDALQAVPDELRDKEMCIAAITTSNRSLRYVPEHLEEEMTHYSNNLIKNKKSLCPIWTKTSLIADLEQCIQTMISFANVGPNML